MNRYFEPGLLLFGLILLLGALAAVVYTPCMAVPLALPGLSLCWLSWLYAHAPLWEEG